MPNPCYGKGGKKGEDKSACWNCRVVYDCFKLLFKHSNKISEQELTDAKIRQRILRSSKYISAGNEEYPDLVKARM